MNAWKYIRSDLCRYVGQENINLKNMAKLYIKSISFKFSFWLRLCSSNNKIVKVIAIYNHRRLSRKHMIDIPRNTKIGYGLYIGHGGCIVINSTAVIGNNINLSQFTTIGSNKDKAAEIGDCVYIGPSVCIVENVKVGSNVKIGAGSVVVNDIESNSTAVGVPATVVKRSNIDNEFVHNKYNPSLDM